MRHVLLASCVAVALAGMAACDSDPPADPARNQVNATPRDQLRDGGQLVWPLAAMPSQYNLHHVDGAEAGPVVDALMPRMFRQDAGGDPQRHPAYLDAVAVASEPKQVVRYRLNAKARWSDGRPLAWGDLAAQWRALSGANGAFQSASSTGYEDIENVEAGGPNEVVVTFARRFADWQSLFSPLYPASVNGDPAAFNHGWLARPLVTAGPFAVANVDTAGQVITLARADGWWGSRAKLDKIIYRVLGLDGLVRGDLDVLDVGADAAALAKAKSLAGVDVREAGGPQVRHLTVNGTGAILGDVRVRQAIARAIDRAAIARAVLGNGSGALGNHLYLSNHAGHRDNSTVVAYHQDRARADLDAAGWRLAGATRRREGRELALRLVVPANVAVSRREAELIQTQLGQIGVRVDVETVPAPAFFDDYVAPGNFDLTVFAWRVQPYPISSSRSLYTQPRMTGGGELDIRQNFARVGSPQIDTLYEQARGELDRGRAVELVNQIDRLIWEQVGTLPLYQRPERWACRTGLANIGAFGVADPVYEDIGWPK